GPAAERIGRLMESLEVEPIEHPWVARSIASAQKKVEGMHFDARKHVVEYDDVMNKQRQIVYEERRKVLEGADARGNILVYVREIIQKVDWEWMEYLTQKEHFREGIALRAYGQRDPLVEYKNEAFEMFNELRDRIESSIVANIYRVQVQRNAPPPPAPPLVRQVTESGPGEVDGANGAGRGASPQQRRAAPVGAGSAAVPAGAAAKIGRNDPCWCGSGKKYKRCHGR